MRMRVAPFWSRMYFSVGRAAVMRVSSVIRPFLQGTLKSTRTRRVFFLKSTSRTVFLAIRMLLAVARSPQVTFCVIAGFSEGDVREFPKIYGKGRTVSTASPAGSSPPSLKILVRMFGERCTGVTVGESVFFTAYRTLSPAFT